MILEVLAVIGIGFLGGYYLSIRYQNHATALQSAIQLIVATVWVGAAIVTIYTGFYAIGAAMLMLFSYFWMSNYRTVRDSEIRQKASSWDPGGFQQK